MLQLSVLQVDGVYHATFFCYLIPIPAFLLYLFAKQHVALQPTKLLVSFSKETTSEGKELHFARIPCDSDSQLVELKDCPRVQLVMLGWMMLDVMPVDPNNHQSSVLTPNAIIIE